MDIGDFVVVNAKDIKLWQQAPAKCFSSLRSRWFPQESAGRLMDRDPRKVVEHAVNSMLAKNKLQISYVTPQSL